MDSNFKVYDFVASFERIDGILAQPQGAYVEKDKLPDRDELTFENGFYAYCSALFVDIRDSSKLPNIYRRPALAKLYRAFLSEMVAVHNSDGYTREVNIVGDCVWSVHNTPSKTDIDDVFPLAYTANSLVNVLNYKLNKAGYPTPIKVGIGMTYGRALMIKAGYSGSGINDVVYMGDVVNQAAKLASMGSKDGSDPIVTDLTVYQNLNDHNTKLLTKRPYLDICTGNVIHRGMEEWYNANCK
jgi:class 3 adenylate cyclase